MSTNARRVDAIAYRFRLILPDTAGAYTVLGQPYSALALPTSSLPASPDFAEGTYSTRDGDAGEFSITFPNAANSAGYLYRELFDPDGDRQFLEIWEGLDLAFVGVVQRVDVDRSQVTVSGPDASALLRKAYERDMPILAGPAEAVSLYTRVPRLLVGDDFEDGSLDPLWTRQLIGPGGGTVTTETGGVYRITESVGGQTVELRQTPGGTFRDWEFRVTVATAPPAGGDAWTVALEAREAGGAYNRLELAAGTNTVQLRGEVSGTAVLTNVLPANPTAPFTLTMEARGRWVRAFIDGRLVGHVPRTLLPATFAVQVYLAGAAASKLELEQVSVTAPVTFLQPGGTIMGEHPSPVDLPWGGLRGQYWNDADFGGDSGKRRFLALSPDREPFLERIEPPDLDTPGVIAWPPVGSAQSGHWTSIRWSGWIYIDAGAGTQTALVLFLGAGRGRLWFRDLNGPPVIDRWYTGSGSAETYIFQHSTLSNRSGWVPIVVEVHEAIGKPDAQLLIDPDHNYTDPGGTSITTAGPIVPVTSLSPAGLVAGRVQGQSHFDLAYGTARDFGYQMRLVPHPLESGSFPGVLAPYARIGRDTDVLLVPEEDEKGEPILVPGRTLDSSDQAVRVRGSANGLNGNRGNVTAEVIDIPAARSSLFVTDRWVDAGDISDERFLASRLAAELTLVGSPWEEVRGTPLAQDRLADSWPLSGVLAAMRWDPGDGVRLQVRDCGIDDVLPRRITQVTRQFGAEGRTGATVSFRNRPRGTGPELRRMLRSNAVGQRSVNVQLVTIPGEYITSNPIPAGGGVGGYSRCALMPGDEVIRAYVRIVVNTGNQPIGFQINGVDRTSALSGPWSYQPVEVDVTAYAVPANAHDPRIYVLPINTGAANTILEHQVIVEVLRRS